MITKQIIEVKGSQAGETSFVLAGVHGNETCGVAVLERMIPSLKIERGKVYFAFGNPRAIELNVRQTEANLNRMFKDDDALSPQDRKSYEYARAQQLRSSMSKADVLLDIHASTTPESRPFVICEFPGNAIAQYLPVDIVVGGFDAVQPGGTDSFMNKIGKIGLCVECGYLGDPASEKTAEACLMAFLQARGHIPGHPQPVFQKHIVMKSMYLAQTEKFVPARAFKDFESIAAGTCLGYDGDQPILCDKDSIILFARVTSAKGAEAFLLGQEVQR